MHGHILVFLHMAYSQTCHLINPLIVLWFRVLLRATEEKAPTLSSQQAIKSEKWTGWHRVWPWNNLEREKSKSAFKVRTRDGMDVQTFSNLPSFRKRDLLLRYALFSGCINSDFFERGIIGVQLLQALIVTGRLYLIISAELKRTRVSPLWSYVVMANSRRAFWLHTDIFLLFFF